MKIEACFFQKVKKPFDLMDMKPYFQLQERIKELCFQHDIISLNFQLEQDQQTLGMYYPDYPTLAKHYELQNAVLMAIREYEQE